MYEQFCILEPRHVIYMPLFVVSYIILLAFSTLTENFFLFGNSVAFGVFDFGCFRPHAFLSSGTFELCVLTFCDVGPEQCHRRSRHTPNLLVNFHLYWHHEPVQGMFTK